MLRFYVYKVLISWFARSSGIFLDICTPKSRATRCQCNDHLWRLYLLQMIRTSIFNLFYITFINTFTFLCGARKLYLVVHCSSFQMLESLTRRLFSPWGMCACSTSQLFSAQQVISMWIQNCSAPTRYHDHPSSWSLRHEKDPGHLAF